MFITAIQIFGLGAWEIGAIAILVVVLFGSQAPKLIKRVGTDAKAVQKEIKEVFNDEEGGKKDDKKS